MSWPLFYSPGMVPSDTGNGQAIFRGTRVHQGGAETLFFLSR